MYCASWLFSLEQPVSYWKETDIQNNIKLDTDL